MTFVAKKTGSILIPTGDDVKHLFVILTDKDHNNQHLLVNISSIDDDIYYDKSCELGAGCHKFVTGPSFVYYEFGQSVHHAKIAKLVGLNYYVPHDDFDQATFEKVCNGIAPSRAPRWFKEQYRVARQNGF